MLAAKTFSFLFIFYASATRKFAKNNYFMGTSCEASLGEHCVEIRKCSFFAELLDKSPIPRPKEVIRIIRAHHCGLQGNTPMVCCSTLAQQESTALDMESRQQDLEDHPNISLLPRENCGTIPSDVRITTGRKTSIMEFPWMALLAYLTDGGVEFKCGGTLINDRYVLTAAHCVNNQDLIGVRLGEHDIRTEVDCDDYDKKRCAPPVQDFYVEEAIVHPDYKDGFVNDIALLKLATPANLSYDNVKPICLPFSSSSHQNLSGQFAIIAGWGVTETGYKSPVLLKTSIPIVPNYECRRIYENFTKIDVHHICAGGYMGRDSCGGDSGGPLKFVSPVNGAPKYIQYGIVSFGPKYCGMSTRPGVYTRITQYMEWILDNLKAWNEQREGVNVSIANNGG